MKIFEIKLILRSENLKDKSEAITLFYEQWLQTPASDDGDTIEILSCEENLKRL